ncbi:gliding motility-associated C-terminal domain-containing protein [Chitinophaga eiseniae]|uniref:Gliding motility-associated C-terminal domain-containing protein n=1 Tax=Chitinophaga eiseniae TaxID=634771 RepID=A0A1T4SKM0_9BACT|nr:Ig-like domain-containing protein [Chitinophaga eiseniae]SKA28713.1 gliding motility-associated C-terminal domain-containing protein [Chitinophaga eiseniae]
MHIPTLIRSGWSCLLWCLLLVMPASAQFSVTDFSNTPLQTAITRDKFNNIYSIAYSAGSSCSVITKFLNGSTGNLNWIYTSPSYVPYDDYYWGIAVNANGDVYFTASDGGIGFGRVMRLRFNGTDYLPVETVRSGTGYINLAFDQQENLIVMEEDGASGIARLMKYAKGNESGAGTVLYDGMQNTTFTSHPTGLAVDKNNTIYFTGFWDFSNKNNIYRLKNGETVPTKHGSGTYTSLTCDDAGYLYAVDAGSGNGASGVIWRFDPETMWPSYLQSGISATISNNDPPQLPWGIMVDRASSTIYYNQYTSPGIRKLTATPVTVTEMSLMNNSPTNAASVRYKVAFNPTLTSTPPKEAFSVSTTGSIAAATVTQVQSYPGYYTVDVSTGTGDGTLALVLTGNNMINPVNSAPVTASAYAIDRTPPSGALMINNGAAYTNNTTVTLDVTASDASSGVTMAFSNDGVTYSAAQPLTPLVTWSLPPADGKKTVYMKVQDQTGNYQIIQKDITLDTQAPLVTITTGPPTSTSSTQAAFAFMANESASFEARLDGSTPSATTSPLVLTGMSVGTHVLEIRATDPAGNQSAWKPYSWTVETSPAVTGLNVPVDGYYNAGTSLDFSVTFSSPVMVTGTPFLPVGIGAATVEARYTGGTGTNTLTFSYTVQPGDEGTAGIAIGTDIQLNGGTIQSTAGTGALLTLGTPPDLSGVKVHTAAPTVVLTTGAPAKVNAPFIVTLTFSEPVTGLAKEDFQVSNGEVTGLQGANNLFVATIGNFADGPVEVLLPANVAVNIAGTGNSASNKITVTADQQKPAVTLVAVPPNGYYHVGDDISFDVSFDEDIVMNTGGGAPYLELTIGSAVKQATCQGNNAPNKLSFSYKVAPGDRDMDGIAVGNLQLNGATIRDQVGNDAILTLNNVGNTVAVRVNTTMPTCVLSLEKTVYSQPFRLTLSFSEPVVGLSVSDLNILNVTVSDQLKVNDSTFTFLLAPTPTREGPYSLYLPMGTVQQKEGDNINLPSNTLTFTWDVTPPKVTSVAVPADGYYRTGKPLDFYVTMSEPVTITGRPTLPVIIGSKTILADYISNTSGTVFLFRYIVQNGDMDMDGIAVGSGLALNNGTLEDAAGNGALPALQNVGSTSQVKVYTAVPSVTLGTTAVSPLNHDFTITAVFSEKMDGLLASAFNAANADISNLQTTDNITYTAQVKPRQSGNVDISLPANAATNIAGTGNSASNTLNVTYDATPPQANSVDVPSAGVYAAGRVMNFSVWYNEPVIVTGSPYLAVTVGNKAGLARYIGAGGNDRLFFVYQVIPGDMDADGITLDNTIQLNGGTIKDAAGNDADLTLQGIPSMTGVLVNAATPTVTLSTAAASPVSSAFTITATFSEAVTGLTGAAFQVTNGTLSNLATADNQTYTATITPSIDGTVIVTLPADVVTNNANTGNTASNTLTLAYDATKPEITSIAVPRDNYYIAGEPLNFVANFSEGVAVTGLPSIPVIIGAETVQATYTSGSGTNALTFVYVVKNGDNDMDGISVGAALQLNGGTVKDVAGNNTLPGFNNVGNTSRVFVNTRQPGVTINTAATSPITQAFLLKITFSEAVTGFAESNIDVINGNASQLLTSDNITYTALITPSDGVLTIMVPAGVVRSVAGNANTASNILNLQADMTAPVVTSVGVPSPGYYNAGQQLNFVLNMSEPVTATAATQLTVYIGGAIVPATLTGGTGTTTLEFSCTVQDGFMDMDGITLGRVLNGIVKDIAGNAASPILVNIGNTSGVFVNTQHPTVSVTTTAVSPVRQPFPVTITFSEAVTGFTTGGIHINNGTAGVLQTTDNITYTTMITPSADGNVTVQVPAGMALNVGQNDNVASNMLSLQAKITAPLVARVDAPANGYYTTGQPLNFKVTMSEPVTVTGTPSIPVIIGSQTVQATYAGGTGTATLQFSYTVQNGDMDMNGITLGTGIQLNAGTLKDAAGNNANLTLNNVGNTSGVFVNTQRPSVVISTAAVSPVRQPFLMTITFSEAVNGFTATGITTMNAVVSQLQTIDNITYTALVTPSADGPLTLLVPSGIARNIAGNDNQASNTILLTADVTAPMVINVSVPSNGTYKAGQSLNFSAQLSEPVNVTGVPSMPLTIGTQTVQATYIGGTGTATLQFLYVVQQGDMDPDGIGVGNAIALNGGAMKDAAGNNAVPALQQVPATSGVLVKTNRPAVTLSSASSGRINRPFTVDLTFADPVHGLTVAALQVTNGVASQLQTTDNIHYSVLITPAADGNVAVQLPAGVVSDDAGNGNLASNQLGLQYDATAPAIGQQSFDIDDNSPAGTLVGQLQGTDASGTVQGWTLVADGSGGALSLAAGGRITVKDNTLLRAVAGKTITLKVTASDGLNTSAAVPVTVKVRISYVNKQPVMDPVADVYLCATSAVQTIQLTGVSPVEADQHYTITLAASQPYFDILKADVVTNTIRYQLKPGIGGGSAAVTITMKDDGGTDNGGKDTYSQTFFLTVNPLPGVSISSDKGGTISKGDIVMLTATGAAAYSWKPAGGTSGSLQEPTLTVKPTADATYQVTGTSAAGCSAMATISIRVTDDYKLDATNLLTPNGDGKNDRWIIRNLDSYPDNEVKIFDRAGRLVYQRRNYSNDWDGTLNGHPLAEGTYYYVLTVNGTSRVWKGFITIIRNDQ